MRKTRKIDILEFVLRWALALVFIYAGAVKIMDPNGFAEQIDNYRVLPYILVTLMAAILPWIEILCGLLLILGKGIRGSSLILVALNVVFLIAISSAMARGLDITCGCFAVTDEGSRVGFTRLGEDLLFVAAAGFVYWKAVAGGED